MYGNKKYLLIALVGIVLWNMPNTVSTFSGGHSFYTRGEYSCIKCHDVDIVLHTNTTAHDGFTCGACHRGEVNITYASMHTSISNTTPGIEAHSASRSSCYDCHYTINVTGDTTTMLISEPTVILIGESTTTLTVTSSNTITLTGTTMLTG